MSLSRRRFLKHTAMGGLTLGWLRGSRSTTAAESQPLDHRAYLARALYTRQEIADWFAGRAFQFEKYDEELGWVLRDIRLAVSRRFVAPPGISVPLTAKAFSPAMGSSWRSTAVKNLPWILVPANHLFL